MVFRCVQVQFKPLITGGGRYSLFGDTGLIEGLNKKLSYRRETARQLRVSRLANWSCNAQNRRIADVVLLVYTTRPS